MIGQIGGEFKSRLEAKLEEGKGDSPKQSIKGKYFFERFNIPVFSSPDFAPGHRHTNLGNKAYNDWLVGDKLLDYKWEEKVKHIKFAYKLWLERNFLKDNNKS